MDTMMKNYPRGRHFVKKAFHHFCTKDTIKWFEEKGVKLKPEDDGRMFPVTDSSQSIIDCLIREANKYKVDILMNVQVEKVEKLNDQFHLWTANRQLFTADYLCIATGGYHKSSMFKWIHELGHAIEEPVPSLFTFNLPHHPVTKLMGVSLPDVRIKIVGSKLSEQGPLLITHWGLSGPAVLRLSAWGARELANKSYEFEIMVNWLPAYDEQALKEKFLEIRADSASQKLMNKNLFGLPQRLWEFHVQQSGIPENLRWGDLPGKLQNKLIQNLVTGQFKVVGKTTFKEEFVTAGGIKLSEIDPNTMQSKIVPGLFFAGEVMDVDGITGGFNFQHAWTSGFIAAKSVSMIR